MTDTLVRSMTLEDYLALPTGPPFYEFEEGELIELAQPAIPHQDITDKLVSIIKPYVRANGQGRVFREVDAALPDGRSYVPDINFVSSARLAELMPAELRLEGAPDLVVEITSPDAARDRVHEFRIYYANGVAWRWIVEQETLAVEEWRAGAAGFEPVSRASGGEVFRPARFPGLEINLAARLGAAQGGQRTDTSYTTHWRRTSMEQAIYQADAFTNEPFAGNPAAVCILPAPREADWMQRIAAEMNLAETAFLVKREDGSYDLRWFSPALEVDLCGHATLAGAHILWETETLSAGETARFHTRSGLLTAQRDGGWITLDFPAEPAAPVDTPAGLAAALGVTPLFVGKNRFDYLIEVETETIVRGLTPDFAALLRIPARGFIVTAPSDTPAFDFVSRFFGPEVGIVEDSVTGSAHCCLGPFWQARLGRAELTGYQASRRGGTVRVRVNDKRVLLGGQAVTTLRGVLCNV